MDGIVRGAAARADAQAVECLRAAISQRRGIGVMHQSSFALPGR